MDIVLLAVGDIDDLVGVINVIVFGMQYTSYTRLADRYCTLAAVEIVDLVGIVIVVVFGMQYTSKASQTNRYCTTCCW